MSMKKWKEVEDTLRGENLRFGFSAMMGAVSTGQVGCRKDAEGLWLDIDQARAWAVDYNRARLERVAKRKGNPAPESKTLFDSAEQLQRIVESLQRIEKLMKRQ